MSIGGQNIEGRKENEKDYRFTVYRIVAGCMF
jgi:hypothetical protein